MSIIISQHRDLKPFADILQKFLKNTRKNYLPSYNRPPEEEVMFPIQQINGKFRALQNIRIKYYEFLRKIKQQLAKEGSQEADLPDVPPINTEWHVELSLPDKKRQLFSLNIKSKEYKEMLLKTQRFPKKMDTQVKYTQRYLRETIHYFDRLIFEIYKAILKHNGVTTPILITSDNLKNFRAIEVNSQTKKPAKKKQVEKKRKRPATPIQGGGDFQATGQDLQKVILYFGRLIKFQEIEKKRKIPATDKPDLPSPSNAVTPPSQENSVLSPIDEWFEKYVTKNDDDKTILYQAMELTRSIEIRMAKEDGYFIWGDGKKLKISLFK